MSFPDGFIPLDTIPVIMISTLIYFCYTRNLLTQNRDMLEYISKTLLDEETIDEKRFVELMEKVESDRG